MRLWMMPFVAMPLALATAANANANANAGATATSLMGTGLESSDLERSLRFYREGLGLVEVMRQDGDEVIEVFLAFGTEPRPPFLFLLHPKRTEQAAPAGGASATRKIVLRVTDAAAMAQRLKSLGYVPEQISAHPETGTLVFWVSDPDANRLEIVQSRK